jgi:hypothetical protein
MPEQLSKFQEYINELYDEYRTKTKKRNPSDAQFAVWLGIKPATLNHWLMGYRTPDLVSVIKVSAALAKHGVKNNLRIFDVLGLDRVFVASNSSLEYLIEFWDELPADLIAEIQSVITQQQKKKGKISDGKPPQPPDNEGTS